MRGWYVRYPRPRDLSPDEVQARNERALAGIREYLEHEAGTPTYDRYIAWAQQAGGGIPERNCASRAGLAGGATPSSRPEGHQLVHSRRHPPARAAPGKNRAVVSCAVTDVYVFNTWAQVRTIKAPPES